MTIPFNLEVFDDVVTRPATPLQLNAISEEEKLQAYEQGYKAGWDDAAAAQAEDQTRISADFARNLQELSFTYHEAKGKVLNALEPLLSEMVSKVLPKLATENLVEMVVEEVQEIARNAANASVELVISPENRPALERLLEGQESLPITIVEEPSLGAGQVYLRFEDLEKKIDLEAVLTRCQQAIDGFFNQPEEDVAYG